MLVTIFPVFLSFGVDTWYLLVIPVVDLGFKALVLRSCEGKLLGYPCFPKPRYSYFIITCLSLKPHIICDSVDL
jgi:hypothetical protein